MFSTNDILQIQSLGKTEQEVLEQLHRIHEGFPFLHITSAASVEHGIIKPDVTTGARYLSVWQQYREENHRIVKFVPASGAASRMFKDLFAFLNADRDMPETDFEKIFFSLIDRFAFKEALSEACKKNTQKDLNTLLQEGQYKAIVRNLLLENGLNYAALPKGLLLFHSYPEGYRTALEEHLVEAALYASAADKAYIHFTVSESHLDLFKAQAQAAVPHYAKQFGINYEVTYSVQKASTDTIAADENDKPFRNEDGTLLFRPGGHGALICNLNEIDADIIFIKNIDNVVPDKFKKPTTLYKQLLAGILIDVQKQVYAYLDLLDRPQCTDADISEIKTFVSDTLCCKLPETIDTDKAQQVAILRQKLNRPIRVCGMVRNQGEPGGGPFWITAKDGTQSLQILESVQVDTKNPAYMQMLESSTHFNPVDLVCAVKDYKGKKFDLNTFVDQATGFLSTKSKDGRTLKALELPGLWNGAMSDWNTIFVEVPAETFNPVKTVNDLLRTSHQ